MHRLNRFRRKKQRKDKDCQTPLLNNIMHTETTDGEQLPNTEKTEQSDVYPDLISTEFVVSGERALDIIREILRVHSNPQDIHTAAVMIKTWGKINGVNVDKKESSYPQDWLCEFQQLIDEYIERHFPIMPVESTTTQRSEQTFLRSTENMMFNEINRLTPVLKDAGLLGYLIQSYIHYLFTKLDLVVNRNLSVNETFCLLQWGKFVLFGYCMLIITAHMSVDFTN
nr:uncharacterized protein LOC129416608 [Misgurnus anguillicaudatus]